MLSRKILENIVNMLPDGPSLNKSANKSTPKDIQELLSKRTGVLLVLSSPSGAGKTTLSRKLLASCPNLSLSISVTTRKPREGEHDGAHYHFVSEETFQKWQKEGVFLEWANVFGDFYGTPRKAVEDALVEGKDILFDIDWQGLAILKDKLPEATVGVFILPPSLAHLRERLTARGDPLSLIEERMQKAYGEISHAGDYDYIVVNDMIEESLSTLEHILEAERQRHTRYPHLGDVIGYRT